MRELKCRGKDERGKWHYGYYVDGYMFDSMTGGMVTEPFIVQAQLNNPQRVVAETIGQYTGLKDKNGNEIYEGDILKYEESINNGLRDIEVTRIAKVSFGLGMFWGGYDNNLAQIRRKAKVIGNIYENPELLEESK